VPRTLAEDRDRRKGQIGFYHVVGKHNLLKLCQLARPNMIPRRRYRRCSLVTHHGSKLMRAAKKVPTTRTYGAAVRGDPTEHQIVVSDALRCD
jgi:hypothetical protein